MSKLSAIGILWNLNKSNLLRYMTNGSKNENTKFLQNGCGNACVPYAMWRPVSLWRRLLSQDSLPIITYVPPNWSIRWKKNWLKTSALYEHLVSSVPYATPCPIHNIMIMLFVYWTTHQLLWSKIGFFLEI